MQMMHVHQIIPGRWLAYGETMELCTETHQFAHESLLLAEVVLEGQKRTTISYWKVKVTDKTDKDFQRRFGCERITEHPISWSSFVGTERQGNFFGRVPQ
jgi:hypothetical protein